MVDQVNIQKEAGIRRTRKRPQLLNVDKQEIVKRVVKFADDDIALRTGFMEDRLQRYAKFRGWTERNTGPWEDSSDITLTDMMTHSTKLQDVLFNALMSSEPPVKAMARNKADTRKETTVDDLIKHQLFVDMKGTEFFGDLVECFINDGVMTVFVPWIRENKDIVDLRVFQEIPTNMVPQAYFRELLEAEFPQSLIEVLGDGWDYDIITAEESEKIGAKFYTRDDNKVELIMERNVEVFNGPRPIVKDIDEVLHPWRAANLQAPSPSNPNGSSHVILVDYPTLDEIKKLKKSGVYDITEDDITAMEVAGSSREDQPFKDQKDDLQGTTDIAAHDDQDHKTLTRYMCFDLYNGKDVIWWVIRETGTLLKAAHLTELYPANPPRRPFGEAPFLPVKGRRLGISYLEMMEGLHDTGKELFDQMIDAGTISNSPFFFYKNSSNNPDMISLGPGDGYPMADPKNDIYFPQIQNNQSFGLNAVNLIEQMQNRLTLTNDLNFGGVPQGSASALRTEGNMQLVLGQSESRPERVMRRLFEGLSEVYYQIHEMNQRFLPEGKKILKTGNVDPDADPYKDIKDTVAIQGRMEFTFSANMLNTSREATNQAMVAMSELLVTELMMNMGIVGADQVYNMAETMLKSLGQDPRQFIKKPEGMFSGSLIFADEAIMQIANDTVPTGRPAETGGITEHLQRISEYANTDDFGRLTAKQVDMLRDYMQKLQIESQRQAVAATAGKGGQPGQPAAPQPNAEAATVGVNQQLSDGETLMSQPGEN